MAITKSYPIVKTDGETIFLLGRDYEAGTPENEAEQARLQKNYRKWESENTEHIVPPGTPMGEDGEGARLPMVDLNTNYNGDFDYNG